MEPQNGEFYSNSPMSDIIHYLPHLFAITGNAGVPMVIVQSALESWYLVGILTQASFFIIHMHWSAARNTSLPISLASNGQR